MTATLAQTAIASAVLSLSNVAAMDAAQLTIAASAAPSAPKAKAKVTLASATLLEVVRALDGSKENRYHTAHAALATAYNQALRYGNKSQLVAVVESDGKKVCERAMRTAIQTIGVLGIAKVRGHELDTLIDITVMQALDVFAAIACKPPVVKVRASVPVKAASAGVTMAAGSSSDTTAVGNVEVIGDVEKVKKTYFDQGYEQAKTLFESDVKGAYARGQADAAAAAAITPESVLSAMLDLIATGVLTGEQMDTLETALLVRAGVASQVAIGLEVSAH